MATAGIARRRRGRVRSIKEEGKVLERGVAAGVEVLQMPLKLYPLVSLSLILFPLPLLDPSSLINWNFLATSLSSLLISLSHFLLIS